MTNEEDGKLLLKTTLTVMVSFFKQSEPQTFDLQTILQIKSYAYNQCEIF